MLNGSNMNKYRNNQSLTKLFSENRLLAAVTVDSESAAIAVARALLEGGLSVMEITFRTPAAAMSIEAIRKEVPDMTVGAGTLLTETQVSAAFTAGAEFGLSPGWNPRITDHALELGLPFIPGVSTPSEIEHALDSGFRLLKLFPADHLGGPGYLKSMEGPYGYTGVRFIPMGGVGPANLSDYAGIGIVAALGGSWLVSSQECRTGDVSSIPGRVRESLGLLKCSGL